MLGLRLLLTGYHLVEEEQVGRLLQVLAMQRCSAFPDPVRGCGWPVDGVAAVVQPEEGFEDGCRPVRVIGAHQPEAKRLTGGQEHVVGIEVIEGGEDG